MSAVLNAPGEIEITFPIKGEIEVSIYCLEPVGMIGIQARYATWDRARSMIGDENGHLKVIRWSTPTSRGSTDRYFWEGAERGWWRMLFSCPGEVVPPRERLPVA